MERENSIRCKSLLGGRSIHRRMDSRTEKSGTDSISLLADTRILERRCLSMLNISDYRNVFFNFYLPGSRPEFFWSAILVPGFLSPIPISDFLLPDSPDTEGSTASDLNESFT